MRELVGKAPRDRLFRVKDRNTGEFMSIYTPSYRACPRKCGNIINNYKECKHTKCPCTDKLYSFCFICLELYENGKWPCGSWNQFCGTVAPNQQLG